MFRILFYAAVIYMLLGIRVVKNREWMVVFRSGKYSGYRKEGLHWVVPFVDKTVVASARRSIAVTRAAVITRPPRSTVIAARRRHTCR